MWVSEEIKKADFLTRASRKVVMQLTREAPLGADTKKKMEDSVGQGGPAYYASELRYQVDGWVNCVEGRDEGLEVRAISL